VRAGIIVDVEATPAWRTAEVSATRTMIERVQQRFDLKPERVIGDWAYGAADFLGWMVNEKAVEPHIPVRDKIQRQDDTISGTDFQWDEQANEYRCPQGQALPSEWRVFKRHRTRFTKPTPSSIAPAKPRAAGAPMKARCCPTRRCGRSLATFISPRGMSRAILRRRCLSAITQGPQEGGNAVRASQTHPEARTPALVAPCGARDEFLLAAVAQNLRRMAKW
jgi:hypothetical protein